MHRELNFGQTRRGKNADPSLALIEIMKTALDFVGGHFVFQIHINRGQNPARNGQKVGSENQLRRVERQLLENLASVTVSENRVGGKVVGHRDEMSARRGLLASAG